MYDVGLVTLAFFGSFSIAFLLTSAVCLLLVLKCIKRRPQIQRRKRRKEISERKVNDFVRSVLIEDDYHHYDLLSVPPDMLASTPHKNNYIYDYARVPYEPKQRYGEHLISDKVFY